MTSARLSLLVALACLGSACASGSLEPSPVPGLIESGHYVEALDAAAERHAQRPEDPEVEREYRMATVAVHLQRAREATFDDRDEDALVHIAEAERVDPGNEFVAMWRLKVDRTIANEWLTHAQEFGARGEYANAYAAYEKALSHDPTSPQAQQGLQNVLLLINYRQGRGEEYYKEGVRSLRSYWLHRARVQFDYTTEKYIPDHEDAAQRGEMVDRLLAQERVDIAQEFEDEGLFFAAGNEYRLALLLDPTNAEASVGRERTEREIGATKSLAHADWLRVRERFDEARAELDQGRELTEVQGDRFESAAIDVDQARYQILYDEALRLEHDLRYPEAVEKYTELLAVAGYYEDAITRVETLQDFIARAEDLYASALATDDPAEQLSYLRQLELFWPEYRDVDEWLARLASEE